MDWTKIFIWFAAVTACLAVWTILILQTLLWLATR